MFAACEGSYIEHVISKHHEFGYSHKDGKHTTKCYFKFPIVTSEYSMTFYIIHYP